MPAGFCAGVLTVLEHLNTVDKDMLHANSVLVRVFVGRSVANGRRIEDNDIGEHSLLEKTATVQLEIGRGQAR